MIKGKTTLLNGMIGEVKFKSGYSFGGIDQKNSICGT